MSYTLKNNAYHILGLDISASEKDIIKRSKEIINRLRVDDTPGYDLDIGLFKDFRTEDTVKDALQRLQAPKKKIKEYFFWIQIADSIDEQALGLLKQKNFLSAIRTWQKAAEGQNTKAFFYKKNLAILYCLALSVEDNKEHIKSSLTAWKELVDSDKFWASFSKVYKLHDEQTASEDIISDFKSHVVEYLSDIYTELHHIHKNSDYVNEFQKVFSAKGKEVEKSVLGPAYQAISDAVEKLGKMKVGTDGILDGEEKKTMKELIGLIRTELNKLIDLGLYDDSKTRVMRDRAASVIRSLSIDLHNDLKETEIALGLAKIAEEISGTESSKNKVQADVVTLQGNLKYKENEEKFSKILDPIIDKIKSGKSEKALEEINNALSNTELDPELKKILQESKQTIEERVVKHGKPIGSAPSMFTLNGCGTRIYGDTLYFVVFFIPVIPIARYSLEKHSNRSYSFFGKLELHKWQKYWQYTLIGIVAILILSAMFSSSNSSGASGKFMTDGGRTFSCSDSNYNRALQLKPSSATDAQLTRDINALNTRIDANKAEKNTLDAMNVDNTDQLALDSYNSRVNSYNVEREKLLTDLASWQQRHDAFNSQIDAYNNFLDSNCSPQ